MIRPAEPFLAPVDPAKIGVIMLPKFGWFSTLKNSARNCRFLRSVMSNCFFKAKSTLAKPGPITAFLARFPNVPAGGSTNTQGSNQSDGVPSFWPAATPAQPAVVPLVWIVAPGATLGTPSLRSGEHTSGLQSPCNLV